MSPLKPINRTLVSIDNGVWCQKQKPRRNWIKATEGLFLQVDSVMTPSVTVVEGSYQIRPGFVLKLLWLCCKVFSTCCIFMGSTRSSAYYSLSVPRLWSAGIAACEDSEVLVFQAVSRAECAEWILFFFFLQYYSVGKTLQSCFDPSFELQPGGRRNDENKILGPPTWNCWWCVKWSVEASTVSQQASMKGDL